jgi:hypothetical protein
MNARLHVHISISWRDGRVLKALVLKVLPEPGKPYKSKLSPMFDIAFLIFEGDYDGRNTEKGCHPFCGKSDGRPLFW